MIKNRGTGAGRSNTNKNGLSYESKTSLDTHIKLFSMVKNLKVKFLMSNSDVPLVTKSFVDYQIFKIEARRANNSKNPGSKTMEVIISHKTD